MKVSRLSSLTTISRLLVAFLLSFLLLANDVVSLAETTSDNRTVAEQLEEAQKENGTKQTERESGDTTTSIEDEETAVQLQEEPSLLWSFVKLIGALAFVIFLMLVLLRLFTNRSKAFRQNRTIENIGGVSLGPNRSVQIVRVGEKLLVVGVGENVQLLKEIDTEEEIEQLITKHEQQLERLDVPMTKFANWLGRKATRRKVETTTEEVEFSSVLRKQLEDVSESQKKVHEAMKEQNK